MSKNIIKNRRLIQSAIGVLIYTAYAYYHVSIWTIILVGAIAGAIFGKVFCRWMCPVGFLMELMMGKNPSSQNLQMYNYHKIGCPIAWISGYLNRFSLFKIKRDKSTCTNCGICDTSCYISSLNKDFSIYKEMKKDPTINYRCSKCMVCVDKCPSNSLKYTI